MLVQPPTSLAFKPPRLKRSHHAIESRLRPHDCSSGHGSAAKERVLPGEDAECPELDQMQLELLLPKEKVGIH